MFDIAIKKLTSNRWSWFLMGLPSFPRAQALFRAKRFTMTSPQLGRRLWNQCHQLLQSNVSGCFVECGVWKGGSAVIMGLALKHANQKRDLHLFDSFEGLPEPSEAGRPISGCLQFRPVLWEASAHQTLRSRLG
jgi:hypothetical protein